MILPFLLYSAVWSNAQAATFRPYDSFGAAKSYSDQIILNPPSPPSQVGAVWSQKPNDLQEWSLEIMYRVNGPEHGGKGMAIWYTADRGLGGPVYGSADNWDGLGLFLTPGSDGSGTLRGHLNDRTTTFAKLDNAGGSPFSLNRLSTKTDAEKHAFGSCSFAYRNLGSINSIKVSYNPTSLKVVHDGVLCFESPHISLPSNYYFGASAQSGEIPDSHELFSFEAKASSHTPASANRATVQQEEAQAQAQAQANSRTGKSDTVSALDSAMQRVITKLISDSDKMSARIEELTQMKTKIDRIEESLANLGGSIRAVQNGAPASSDPNFSPKVVYDGLAQQIRGMEEKFAQMEKHIEKQTEHIVNSLPPVAGPLKNAVYVLILVQIVICGAYITYRRKTEEKRKFL